MQGRVDLSADVFYELKNEGYYSEKVFEGYVHRPVVEVAGAGDLTLNVTFFGVLHTYYAGRLNLAKVKLGLQHFLSTRYFDNACLMMFARFEGLSLNHNLQTNLIQCSNNLQEDFTRLTPFQK